MLKLIKDFSKFKNWEDINKIIEKNAIEAGFKPGAYVINNKNNQASKIKELLTSTFAIERKQDCAMAYLDNIYQDYVDVKDLTLISKKEYLNNPFYKLQRKNEKIVHELNHTKQQFNRYKSAFEKLKSNKKISKEVCHYGPCQKSELGICDGECDYPGA